MTEAAEGRVRFNVPESFSEPSPDRHWPAEGKGASKSEPGLKETRRFFSLIDKEIFIETAEKLWRVARDVVEKDFSIIDRFTNYFSEVVEKMDEFDRLEEQDYAEAMRLLQESSELLDRYKGRTDKEAQNVIRDFISKGKKSVAFGEKLNQQYRELVKDATLGVFVQLPDGQVTAVGLARWAANGYPQITMGHKYAASLLCTTVSDDVLDLVKPPWSGFFIEVPDGLIEIYNNELDEYRPIRRILVTQHANKHVDSERAWMYVAFTDTPISIWRFGVSTQELLPPMVEGDLLKEVPQLKMTDRDERAAALIGRLIVNTCLAMSDPDAVKKIGPGHKAYKSGRREEVPEPIMRTFQIGRPVDVDLRPDVHAYVRGETKRLLNVQFMVRGHYRNQAYGPKLSLRKALWIAPHRKGPADSPVVMRPHVLGKKEQDV